MNKQFKPIALVTGANKGIGRQVVQELSDQGYVVYLGCRDTAKGDVAKKEMAAPDRDIRVLQLDVTDDASIGAAARRIEADTGSLDLLINNAGIASQPLQPTETGRAEMHRVFETNLYGPVAVTRAMMPLLRRGERRTIVNVTSELGSVSLHAYPDWQFAQVNFLAYCASKSALNAFTVLLAKELKDEDFRVNAVNPGFTATDLNHHSGTRTVEQAAAVIVKCATAGKDAPTATFFTDGGQMPW